MSDGDSLLRAILSAPEDDAPRLVYADWLDETGEPARAEFIRLQIRRARLSSRDPGWEDLLRAERALWAEHREAWTAWVPDWVTRTEHRRGFLEWVQCDAAAFIGGADELRRQAPVTGVQLDGPADLAVPLFRSRALDGLRALALSVPVPADAWEHLAACPYLAGLEELDLSANPSVHGMGRDVLRPDLLPGLRVLRLRACGLGDEEVAWLFGHPWAARLRQVDLGQNQVFRDGAQALASSPHLAGLDVLDLRHNPLGEDRPAVEALIRRFGGRVRV